MKKVEYILTGYEHGGTTLLSELFRNNGFESGFECGVLRADSPALLKNLNDHWNLIVPGWKVSEAVRDRAVTGSFEEFYDTLCAAAFPDFTGRFFDKTPRYMETLGVCMNRAPFLKGAIVIHRDPRAFFVSLSKRLSPKLDCLSTIDLNFKYLRDRYLSYFHGSIAHLGNANVLFVPFEEMVSREQAWLRMIGHFVSGKSFLPRSDVSRFSNVTSTKMDMSKVVEFDDLLPPALQERILDATRMASTFFAGPVERARYGDMWAETYSLAKQRLLEFDLEPVGLDVDGVYFEPLSYLIRYPDVLKTGANPLEHYRFAGRREQRNPA